MSEFISKSTSAGVGGAVVVAVEASDSVGPAGESARLKLMGWSHQLEVSGWRRVPVKTAEDQSARRVDRTADAQTGATEQAVPVGGVMALSGLSE